MKMKSVALHGKSIWPEVYTRQVITAKKKFTAVLNCALATGTDGENFNGDLSSEEDRVLTLDARGLYDVVTDQDISMCGFGPTVAMLTAARQLGATSAELVKYATSGDVSRDRDMVVGYAGLIVQ